MGSTSDLPVMQDAAEGDNKMCESRKEETEENSQNPHTREEIVGSRKEMSLPTPCAPLDAGSRPDGGHRCAVKVEEKNRNVKKLKNPPSVATRAFSAENSSHVSFAKEPLTAVEFRHA